MQLVISLADVLRDSHVDLEDIFDELRLVFDDDKIIERMVAWLTDIDEGSGEILNKLKEELEDGLYST